EGISPDVLTTKLADLVLRKMGEDIAAYNTYHLQPLLRIHLFSHFDYGFGPEIAEEIVLFASIAGFILLIACINFMNLATARSIRRAHEVGLRKAVGAYRGQLVRQFLSEAILTALFALLIGVGLAELALPAFNYFTGKTLALTAATYGILLPALLILMLLVGLLAGSYPAFFLSRFQPVQVLKGNAQSGSGGVLFRKVLVVFQFGISILLIVGTMVIYQQTHFMQNKAPGFNKDHLIILPLFAWDMSNKANFEDRLSHRYNTVKDAFLRHPNVLKATAYRYDVGLYAGRLRRVIPEGAAGTEWEIPMNEVDEDFFGTFEIPIVAGRSFSADIPGDLTQAYIVNESAVKAFGWKDPIGKRFDWPTEKRLGTVVGVMQDFHTAPMRKKIEPLVFIMRKKLLYNLGLRIRGENLPETLVFLKQTWNQLLPEHEFDYSFMDEDLYRQYEAERRFGETALTFAFMAIFIATLGLFGLAAFTAEMRTREIGIRKVLGASDRGIVGLLSKDFMKLVLLANVFAWPLTYWIMNRWLQNFAYRIDFGVAILLLGGMIAALIAIAVVSAQAFKAARANPIDALRYE
ncbi:MAG: FtsX-like permease family protein, partial [Candidatus Latescibacteria bacterium]|nr:FtsX-like permease family protein [Candidatus Latescibacterota bacterium]